MKNRLKVDGWTNRQLNIKQKLYGSEKVPFVTDVFVYSHNISSIVKACQIKLPLPKNADLNKWMFLCTMLPSRVETGKYNQSDAKTKEG